MPIYHKHRLIHVHIPKTGGTSIEKYLGHKFNIKQSYPEFLWGRDQEKKVIMHHLNCQQILEYVDRGVFDSYLKFAIVRNPYDRLVSEYCWSARWKELYPTFTKFVRN